MAAHTNDEAFHEIQLNGKQLVFLFMSATVVSVVIFLLGVLVGRNVRVQRTAIAQAAEMAESPAPDLPLTTAAPAPQPAADPTTAPPPPTVDDVSAPKPVDPQLAQAEAEALKPAAPRNLPAAAAGTDSGTPARTVVKETAAKDSSKAAAKPAAAKERETAAPAPVPNGFAVQVAALNVRGEADAIAKRLTSKGYAAYVQAPANGAPSVYRVRVGSFKTRREAESLASKLQKEEQFKPWVTR